MGVVPTQVGPDGLAVEAAEALDVALAAAPKEANIGWGVRKRPVPSIRAHDAEYLFVGAPIVVCPKIGAPAVNLVSIQDPKKFNR